MGGSVTDLSKYRLEKAKEDLETARANFSEKSYRASQDVPSIDTKKLRLKQRRIIRAESGPARARYSLARDSSRLSPSYPAIKQAPFSMYNFFSSR